MKSKKFTEVELLKTLPDIRREKDLWGIVLPLEFNDAEFPEINLMDVLGCSMFDNVTFTNCDLTKVDFTGIGFGEVKFICCDLPDEFTRVIFFRSCIRENCRTSSGTIKFNSCILNHVDLIGSNDVVCFDVNLKVAI